MKKTNTGNTAAILESIWVNSGISRIDLAKKLEIDKSTVSNLVGALIERLVVEEYEHATASSLGGRKPVKLRLRKDFGFVVGIEIQADFYRVVLINLQGEAIDARTHACAIDDGNFQAKFVEILERLKIENENFHQRCLGIGIGISAIVDPFSGTVIESTSLHLRNFAIGKKLEKIAEVPVHLENDANAACWGEVVMQRFLGDDRRSFLFCLVETHDKRQGTVASGLSIGLGFVVGGEVYYGENFSAGEFKSLSWKEGNTFQFSFTDAEMDTIAEDAELQARFSRELAQHVVFLARVFNLNRIFIGGGDEVLHAFLVDDLEREKRKYWPDGNSPCVAQFSSQGLNAVAYGAACLALTNFFRDPEIMDRVATFHVVS